MIDGDDKLARTILIGTVALALILAAIFGAAIALIWR
jgi:hypothetical protein